MTTRIRDAGVSDPQLFDIRRQARIEVARRAAKRKDILEWGKALFPEKFNLPFCCELHGYFVKIRGEEFTNTKAPRNHAKTAIKCFLIPLFQALEEPETFRHYMNVQATKEKALSINVSIKTELEENDLLREIYGDTMGERWTDTQFVLTTGVIFTAISTGQSIRGINYRQTRPDYIIGDDLYDEEDINNPESTQKKNAWFFGSLYPARAKSRRCSIHVQGTAINHYDLLATLEKDDTVESRTFQAVKDWDAKVVLWPELNTFADLEKDLKRMGSLIFFREMQNEPRDEATAIVKRIWLYRVDGTSWEYDPIELHRRLREPGATIQISAVRVGNDPSIGKKNESDYTGTALVIETQATDGDGHDFWIENVWEEHLTMDARIRQLRDISAGQAVDLSVTQVRIESIAGFNDYADEVIRKTNLPVDRVDWVPDKITNLENRSHYFENGKVHLNKNIDPELKDKVVHQITNNYPKHDDIRDSILLTMDNDPGGWNWVG